MNEKIFECSNCVDWLEEENFQKEKYKDIKKESLTKIGDKYFLKGVTWQDIASYIFVKPYQDTPNGKLLKCVDCGDSYAVHEEDLDIFVNLRELKT